ncbi:NAD(P)-dependent oxidoreductase [Citricoccus sp. K5]|uniref:NAD(P)-dependent oxidoreductase n=1 Tax=Citricoccus sp. K5 TaxID=2653135 RepID=UPI0012F31875|nr:NAD(P)-dependent oxidoreductase [Citricoccus sp. K5]VXC10882.1 NAD(P)-dependent oxidoreductase [Citricoccus sp. K5]
MPSASPLRITFIGIGAIGLPMARQLLAAGFEVTGVDPSAARREEAAVQGLSVEPAPDSAAEADVVVCMVATPDQLRTAALGDDGVLGRMRDGAVLLVMSTVGPRAVQDVADEAPPSVRVVDVPVTGGVARAITGDLRLFASGPRSVVEEIRPVLDALGTVIDCGAEIGQGQSYKAVNQLLCSVHIVAAAEALALAEELGLDPEKVFSAVAGGAGASWMLSERGPRMLQGLEAEVTSTIGIFVKDSTLVKEIADDLGFDAPMITAAQAKYRAAQKSGWDRKDDSQVIQTYRRG